MSATFANYDNDKWWWFYVYLVYAEAISGHPELKAKNHDFIEYFEAYLAKNLGEKNGLKIKTKMGVL